MLSQYPPQCVLIYSIRLLLFFSAHHQVSIRVGIIFFSVRFFCVLQILNNWTKEKKETIQLDWTESAVNRTNKQTNKPISERQFDETVTEFIAIWIWNWLMLQNAKKETLTHTSHAPKKTRRVKLKNWWWWHLKHSAVQKWSDDTNDRPNRVGKENEMVSIMICKQINFKQHALFQHEVWKHQKCDIRTHNSKEKNTDAANAQKTGKIRLEKGNKIKNRNQNNFEIFSLACRYVPYTTTLDRPSQQCNKLN